MKRVLLMVCSICLVLACIFGLFACVAGVQDILNVKEYKTSDADTAREGIQTARDGVQQLKENQQAYLDGADTFSDGLAAYNEGAAKLAAGEKAYAEGKKAYEEGLKAYEEGKKKIEENTQAYNEGKAMLEKIEPLMPYLDQYIQFRDGSLAKLPGFDSAQLWFVGVVRPLAKNLGLEIPEDVTDFPAYMQQMVAEGKAKLKEYEDGLKQLQEAEKMLADAEKQLAEGKAQLDKGRNDLAAGGAQLADGDAQLNVFEQGEVALAEGAYTLFHGMVPCYHWYSGEETIMSLPEYMAKELNVAIPDNLIIKNTATGENAPAYVLNEEAYAKLCDDVVAQMYLVDENGEKVVAPGREGFTLLDLDKCSVLLDKAEQYLVDQEADITKEVTGRIVVCGLAAIACILGIVAGIIGLVGGISGNGKTGFGCGLVSAILAVAANVVGLTTGYTNYIYPTRVNAAGDFVTELADMDHYVYSGSLQLKAVIILAVVAVVFVIVAAIARKASKDSVSAVSAETTQAAAAGAAAAAAAEESSSEQISKLEAENAALKEMVANLAAEAATVKE